MKTYVCMQPPHDVLVITMMKIDTKQRMKFGLIFLQHNKFRSNGEQELKFTRAVCETDASQYRIKILVGHFLIQSHVQVTYRLKNTVLVRQPSSLCRTTRHSSSAILVPVDRNLWPYEYYEPSRIQCPLRRPYVIKSTRQTPRLKRPRRERKSLHRLVDCPRHVNRICFMSFGYVLVYSSQRHLQPAGTEWERNLYFTKCRIIDSDGPGSIRSDSQLVRQSIIVSSTLVLTRFMLTVVEDDEIAQGSMFYLSSFSHAKLWVGASATTMYVVLVVCCTYWHIPTYR